MNDDSRASAPAHGDPALAKLQARAAQNAADYEHLARISDLLPRIDRQARDRMLSRLPRRAMLHTLVITLVLSSLLVGRAQMAPGTAGGVGQETLTYASGDAWGGGEVRWQRPSFDASQPNEVAYVSDASPSSAQEREFAMASTTRNEPLVLSPAPEQAAPPIEEISPEAQAKADVVAAMTERTFYQPIETHISADLANLRSGPSTDFERVGTLEKDASVQIIARSGTWLQISAEGYDSAWVAADLLASTVPLEVIPEAQSVPELPPALVAVVAAESLNLRDGPGTDYVGIEKMAEGTQIDLLHRYGDWYQVQTADGNTGWVTGEFLSMKSGVADRVPVTEEIPSANPSLVGWTVDGGINLRTGPGTGYESLGKLDGGAELTITATYGDWYKVISPRGTNGWVAVDYVSTSAYVKRRIPETNDIPALPKPKPAPAPIAAPVPSSSAWVWPSWGTITSYFGWRNLGGYSNFHNGVDIANARGTPISAIHGGTVYQAGWCSGYGYCVMIDHGNGLTSEYGHMMSWPTVSNGQYVSAGQLIGYMGSTYDAAGGGYSSGVHLHLTIKSWGTAVNPFNYVSP